MTVYFVKLLNDEGEIYHSYREELWRLVELCRFPTCGLGDIDYESDNYYICYIDNGNTKANFTHEQAKNRNCKLVLWDLEWPHWESGRFQMPDRSYYDEVWCSDKYQKCLYCYHGLYSAKYVFMGGHPGFGGEPRSPKKWDFCPMSYNYGERLRKIGILRERGYTMAPVDWGEIKREALAYSTWGLALQQFNSPFIAPQRFLLFASWHLPILVDYVRDPYPYRVYAEGLVHYDPANTICANPTEMRWAVNYNYHLVTTRTFEKSVTDAVKGIEVK